MDIRLLLLAVALAALVPAARAQDRTAPPPRTAPAPPPRGKPLSAEDAEVVKQLALLEQVELLRNLELFEGRPPDSKPQDAKEQDDSLPPDPQREP